MWLLVSTRDPESQLPVDIERYLDVIKSKLSYEGRRCNWKQQQFLCGVLYLQWTTLLTLKGAHGREQVSCESWFPYLWEQVLLIFGFDDSVNMRAQLLYYEFWVSIGVSYNASEIYAMVTRSGGQMKHPVLCCTLYLTCLLQLSVNICWINEWTNEYVLVTTVTKTNEIWSLPLRSSQSIEHKQQIKYWSCLLGSTFFYYRKTISSMSSCYSYRHTNETARSVKMYLGGAGKGRGSFPLILQR